MIKFEEAVDHKCVVTHLDHGFFRADIHMPDGSVSNERFLYYPAMDGLVEIGFEFHISWSNCFGILLDQDKLEKAKKEKELVA